MLHVVISALMIPLNNSMKCHLTQNYHVRCSKQVFSMDMRAIHPRRPLAEPSKSEKEEVPPGYLFLEYPLIHYFCIIYCQGFFQYNPFLLFNPQTAVTLDQTVGSTVKAMTTSVSKLESTTLLFCYGGLDVFFNRVQSSGAFDILSSDFNHPLLVLILAGLALLVFVLKRLVRSRSMKSKWA